MKEEYREFVGIYDESVPVKLCNAFVEDYEEAKKNQTIIDCTVENELGILEKNPPSSVRKDEVVFVAPLYSTIYPVPPVKTYLIFYKNV